MGKDAGAVKMENQLYLVNTCFFTEYQYGERNN